MKRKFNITRMQSFVKRGNILLEEGKNHESMDLIAKGMDYYSNRIINAISPYATSDAGLLVIALRYVADQIERKNFGAKEFAEKMSEILIFPDMKEVERIEKPNRR